MSLIFIGQMLLVLMCGVMGAGAFTREREAGTGEALGLLLLSARSIILGKLLPPIVAAVVYSIIVRPLLLQAMTSAVSLFGIGCFWLFLLRGAVRDGVRKRER